MPFEKEGMVSHRCAGEAPHTSTHQQTSGAVVSVILQVAAQTLPSEPEFPHSSGATYTCSHQPAVFIQQMPIIPQVRSWGFSSLKNFKTIVVAHHFGGPS